MARENRFQARLIRTLKRMFPGCYVLKNDSAYMQGVPDLIVLWQDRWAMLECKSSESYSCELNQEYYVHELDKMSFAAIIYPQNEEEVLRDLQQAFQPSRTARIS